MPGVAVDLDSLGQLSLSLFVSDLGQFFYPRVEDGRRECVSQPPCDELRFIPGVDVRDVASRIPASWGGHIIRLLRKALRTEVRDTCAE